MSEVELHKAIIRQAREDLFSKIARRKKRAIEWIYSTFGDNRPIITCEECCDLSGLSLVDTRRIADAIIAGKLTYKQYREIMKEEYVE